MSELAEQAKALGIEVKPEWSEQYLRRAITMAQKAVKPATFPVKLLKNYRPAGDCEIIGHHRDAVKQKDAAGNVRIIEPEKFVEGEMNPPPHPGVGFTGKIWAGTHIRLPVEEAKTAVAKKIAERADAIAA